MAYGKDLRMKGIVAIILGVVLIVMGVISKKVLVPRSHIHAQWFGGYLGSEKGWKVRWQSIWIGGTVMGTASIAYGIYLIFA